MPLKPNAAKAEALAAQLTDLTAKARAAEAEWRASPHSKNRLLANLYTLLADRDAADKELNALALEAGLSQTEIDSALSWHEVAAKLAERTEKIRSGIFPVPPADVISR
jgi:hypothetical protein